MSNGAVGSRQIPFGLIGVLATVTMLFTAFTASYIVRRTSADWRPIQVPSLFLINTIIVVASSICLEIGVRGRGGWVGVAAALGIAFLLGQVAGWVELSRGGVFLQSHPHSSFFYVMTGLHGIHLLGGIIALVYASIRTRGLGSCRIYWHFVGIVWIYLLVLLTGV